MKIQLPNATIETFKTNIGNTVDVLENSAVIITDRFSNETVIINVEDAKKIVEIFSGYEALKYFKAI